MVAWANMFALPVLHTAIAQKRPDDAPMSFHDLLLLGRMTRACFTHLLRYARDFPVAGQGIDFGVLSGSTAKQIGDDGDQFGGFDRFGEMLLKTGGLR